MQIRLQDVDVHLVDRGTGPPILFLHGNPDTGELWRGVISRLDADHRCLAPDLPGFGRSIVRGDFDCRLETMADFVDRLVTAIGVDEPIFLAVHDFGGPYGLSWAIRHPHKVRRIAILDSLYFADYRWHFWARVWRTPLLGELSMWCMNRWIFAWELRRGSRRLAPEHIRDTWQRVHPAMKRMVLRLYRATDPENFRGWQEELHALARRLPVRVLWGAHDPYIPVPWARRFGTADVRVFEDCGHWLPAEAPARVAEDLGQFFAPKSKPWA